MEQAGIIKSNLKRAVGSWEDERMHTPAEERIAAAMRERVSDRQPSTQAMERLQEEHEAAVEASKPQRWRGQERWQGKDNEAMRLVNIMHPHSIFAKLRRAGVDARTESPFVYEWGTGSDGKPVLMKLLRDTGRLWFNEDSKVGLLGVNAWVTDEDTGERMVRTVTTLQYPYGPEWSLFHFDEFGVITKEKYRGWRTAMLHLVYANVLTETEVSAAFGPISLNTASLFYRQQMQTYRTRRMGLTA